MGQNGLKFYRTSIPGALNGTNGLIAAADVVLIKVNAQWKYRGCTNSDLVRGVIQRILEHPDGFSGEVVIVENGQGRGSLACNTSSSYGGDTGVHANAQDESHSFLWLVNSLFNDSRVSAFLLDPIRGNFIGASEHSANGYRTYENVSYPCFTTAGGRRVELREGVWNGTAHGSNLKLINIPVLKHHDTGGSEITGAVKHVYGLVSMSDGNSDFRHYGGLGETCGKMFVSVHTPVLNIMDAIWVSQGALTGYPASATHQGRHHPGQPGPRRPGLLVREIRSLSGRQQRAAPPRSRGDRRLADRRPGHHRRPGRLRPVGPGDPGEGPDQDRIRNGPPSGRRRDALNGGHDTRFPCLENWETGIKPAF